MGFSSLRLSLLRAVEAVLRRWLGAVSAQLEPELSPSPAPSPEANKGVPPPPDHWVELVRQYAPQLLEADSSGVVDYRAAGAPVDVPQVATPTPKASATPVHLLTPTQPQALKPPIVRSAPN